MKREFVGYVDPDKPPKCGSLNCIHKLRPSESKRLQHFGKALRRQNKVWLNQLTLRIIDEIARVGLPREFLDANGGVFLEEGFADNAFTYISIQLLRLGIR